MKGLLIILVLIVAFSKISRMFENGNGKLQMLSVRIPSATFSADTNSSSSLNLLQTRNTDNLHNDDQTITLRPLGDIDDDDLYYAADVIKEFFGYNVVYSSKVPIDRSMYDERGQLNIVSICAELGSCVKTIYITDSLLYDKDGNLLRGFTSGDDRTIVVRGEKRFMQETIIHEMGHSMELTHCNDLTCIMAIDNDAFDSGTFCAKCMQRLVLNGFYLKNTAGH